MKGYDGDDVEERKGKTTCNKKNSEVHDGKNEVWVGTRITGQRKGRIGNDHWSEGGICK
jgi:hypothetical protein